jgi:hypothetical protein
MDSETRWLAVFVVCGLAFAVAWEIWIRGLGS